MRLSFASLLFFTANQLASGNESGQIWAVLVAGSSEWYNYRHQADVCHAYQILHRHGVPDERIIVMMTDDIANNTANPQPGVIINHPQGKDVYSGVPKDYIGDAVTPETFLKVLRGDSSGLNGIGSGKVLKSGPNDHVFVNFVDHGAPGILAFPESELSLKDLNETLTEMYKNKRFGKMVWYVEACESGSMFRNVLPANMNIFVTTAANFDESSYACYWDDERQTYLGDLYSVTWMENTDKNNIEKETLQQQFVYTKQLTNESHVQEYGDFKIGKMPVGQFQGEKQAEPILYPSVPHDAVPTLDVPLITLQKRMESTFDEEEIQLLQRQISLILHKRSLLHRTMVQLANKVGKSKEKAKKIIHSRLPITKLQCHHDMIGLYNDNCFKISQNPFVLKFIYMLANICELGITPTDAAGTFNHVCRRAKIEMRLADAQFL